MDIRPGLANKLMAPFAPRRNDDIREIFKRLWKKSGLDGKSNKTIKIKNEKLKYWKI